jgi:16S rRNA (uracil1498-N3)-methyltransferase
MPYFFQNNLSQDFFTFSSEESKHITKSMRLKEGDFIWITNGKGILAKAALTNIFKDSCAVEIVERNFQDISTKKLHLAIAPTKNPNRMEWLVEKVVEIGVSQITFIICDRSERKSVDLNRLQRIAVAALKQSQGTWLPEINTLSFSHFINESKATTVDKFIAFCDDKEQAIEIANLKLQHAEAIFLIGPEGDFTPQEVFMAKEKGFMQISLGDKILRTETAALFVGCRYSAIVR